MKAYVNGKIIDEDKAVVSIFDRGFLYGDGIFESMRSYGGNIFRLDDHLDRLYSSMKSLKMQKNLSAKEMQKTIYGLLSANNLKDASIRITVSRGTSEGRAFNMSRNAPANIVIVTKKFLPRPVKYYTNGIKADIAHFRRNSMAFSSNFKTINYLDSIIARSEAIPKGSFETIFLDESGYVSEGAVSNVFMANGKKIMTPSLNRGALPGVTRKAILELAPYGGLGIEEGRFTEVELKSSEEVFVTNSLIEVIPVVKVDERIIGEGKVGEVTRKIHALYREAVENETKE